MPAYLAALELNRDKEHRYSALWAELDKMGAHRTLRSLWLVGSQGSAKEVHKRLSRHIHSDDRLWVAEFNADRCHFMGSVGTMEWLRRGPGMEGLPVESVTDSEINHARDR